MKYFDKLDELLKEAENKINDLIKKHGKPDGYAPPYLLIEGITTEDGQKLYSVEKGEVKEYRGRRTSLRALDYFTLMSLTDYLTEVTKNDIIDNLGYKYFHDRLNYINLVSIYDYLIDKHS